MRDPPASQQSDASGVVRPRGQRLLELHRVHGVLRPSADLRRGHGRAGAVALAVARALLPGLEKALQEMPEKELAEHAKLLNGAVAELAPRDAMQKHRLAGALKYVQGKLVELQIEHAWLTKWMEASGFTRYIEGQGERA